jgi:hypothetical protein
MIKLKTDLMADKEIVTDGIYAIKTQNWVKTISHSKKVDGIIKNIYEPIKVEGETISSLSKMPSVENFWQPNYSSHDIETTNISYTVFCNTFCRVIRATLYKEEFRNNINQSPFVWVWEKYEPLLKLFKGRICLDGNIALLYESKLVGILARTHIDIPVAKKIEDIFMENY